MMYMNGYIRLFLLIYFAITFRYHMTYMPSAGFADIAGKLTVKYGVGAVGDTVQIVLVLGSGMCNVMLDSQLAAGFIHIAGINGSKA